MKRIFSFLRFFLLPLILLSLTLIFSDGKFLGQTRKEVEARVGNPLHCLEETTYSRCHYREKGKLREFIYENNLVTAAALMPFQFSFKEAKTFSSPLLKIDFHPFNNYLWCALLFALVGLGLFLCSLFPARKTPPPLPQAPTRDSEVFFYAVIGLLSLASIATAVDAFFASPLPPQIDFYHDGIFLTPSLEARAGKSLFEGSFFHYGPLYEQGLPWLTEKLTGRLSLSSLRLLFQFLQVSILLSVTFLFFAMASWVKKERGAIAGVSLFLLLQGVHLFRWHSGQYTDPRESLNAFTLAVFFLALTNRSRVFLFLTAAWGVGFTLFTMDRGLAFLIIGVGLIAVTERKLLKLWFAGIAAGFLVSLPVFSFSHWKAWWENASEMNRSYEKMMSTPFPFLSSATWQHSLLLGCLALCTVGGILQLRKPTSAANKALALFFLLAPLIYFRSVLARPDLHHVAYGSAYAQLGIAFWIWNGLQRTSLRLQIVSIAVFVVALNPLGDLVRFYKQRTEVATNWALQIQRLNEDDSVFLNASAQHDWKQLEAVFAKTKCLSVFPNTPTAYHLLKKPSCSRFHVSTFASPPRFQNEWIDALEKAQPDRLIYESPFPEYNAYDGVSMAERLPLVEAYLKAHYEFDQDINGWKIYRRKTL